MSEEQRIRIKEEILAYAKNSVENNRRMQLNGIWPHLMHNKLGADDSDTLIKDLTMEIVWQLISDGIFSYLEPPYICHYAILPYICQDSSCLVRLASTSN